MKFLFYHKIFKNLLILILFNFLVVGCGLYKPSDARKVSGNAKERVKKNLEEGKRIRFSSLTGGGSGQFEFASSNEMWRASMDILDFIPLSNADYGGGVIITDWFNDTDENNSVKIMVRFLSNEIRADGVKVTVFSKDCKPFDDCLTSNDDNLSNDIKLAILKKAAEYKLISDEKDKEEFKKKRGGTVPKELR
ncbi:DUF3576 domain-containing protein [Candidatus Pelagibacter sp.]|uniref:DUF3576 domain-containing protein n=1 Tax=Candidatus Pelagibacter sp. TaxID=2024849 RepID=UPI003F84304F